MNITDIDKNFVCKTFEEGNIEYNDVLNGDKFAVFGVFYDENKKEYRRMPSEISKKVNDGVNSLAICTAGGRVKFSTNSPFIGIKANGNTSYIMTNMCIIGQAGCALFMDGKFVQSFYPDSGAMIHALNNKEDGFLYEGGRNVNDGKTHVYELYMPLYNGLKSLYIGTEKGYDVKPMFYEDKRRILFYGSSITQGGCASHPGNDYISILERKFNLDVLNLGFSGSARGEDEMAEYIAQQNFDIFVYDYDYNAPDIDHLEKTHYKMYKRIRDKKPNVPIIMISKPDFSYDPTNNGKRRDVIYNSYKKALKDGDKMVEFIDGEKLFEGDLWDLCTVDSCHPNDLGFYRMAKVIAPYIEKYLK